MRLPSLFSDHMVVQRETPVRLWGWTTPRQTVTVSMAGHTVQILAADDGRWQVSLPALPAGGPYELTITGDESITFHDVMVGEVWVCSGQSNMEMGIEMVQDAEEEIANASYPNLRLFTVEHAIESTPQAETPGAWETCSPESIRHGLWGGFSASAYFFGRELARKLNVPVGLIHSSWGGTVVEAWTSRESLVTDEDGRKMVADLDHYVANEEEYLAAYHQVYRAWAKDVITPDPGNLGGEHGWANPATDTADWAEMIVPCTWQSTGLNFSGSLWFRKEINVPAEWAGQDLTLHLGGCDKDDTTYFNGKLVGSLTHEDRADSWCTPRVYTVPGALVTAGKNVIAVRVYSYAFDGGMRGPDTEMYIEAPGVAGAQPLPLSGAWRYRVEHNLGYVQPPVGEPAMPIGHLNPNSPTMLYNGMIAPVINYAIRGAIWYQGESNASRAEQYQRLFPLLIKDWREKWGQGDFPFLFVQLANFIITDGDPAKGHWAELREAQTMALQVPNTGMAVIADIGMPNDIHPVNKQEVGRRLALQALANVYGQRDLVYSGPLFRAAEGEGSTMRISFDYVGGGLRVADGGTALQGFQIAGVDQVFEPATARIDGDTVIVSSPQVAEPAAVRYAWEDCPACTLFNAEGLPASPFRTDAWPSLIPVG